MKVKQRGWIFHHSMKTGNTVDIEDTKQVAAGSWGVYVAPPPWNLTAT